MKKNTITIDKILHMQIGELSKYPPDQLSFLMQEATARLEEAKRFKNWINLAIKLKYEEHVKAKRKRLGKDTGVIHIDDDGFRLTTVIPKKVEWNQRELQKVMAQLLAKGANIDDFIVTTYKVSERKYKGWSPSLRDMFEPARTVRIGSDTYDLRKIEDEEVCYE